MFTSISNSIRAWLYVMEIGTYINLTKIEALIGFHHSHFTCSSRFCNFIFPEWPTIPCKFEFTRWVVVKIPATICVAYVFLRNISYRYLLQNLIYTVIIYLLYFIVCFQTLPILPSVSICFVYFGHQFGIIVLCNKIDNRSI